MTFSEFLESKTNAEIVALWNETATEHGYESVYTDGLDEMANELFHGRPADFARAVYFGDVHNWHADFAVFNGYGNIVTFDYWDGANSPIDLEQLELFLIEADHPVYQEWCEAE